MAFRQYIFIELKKIKKSVLEVETLLRRLIFSLVDDKNLKEHSHP